MTAPLPRLQSHSSTRLSLGDAIYIGTQVAIWRKSLAAGDARCGPRPARDHRASASRHLMRMAEQRDELRTYRNTRNRHEHAVQFELHRQCSIAAREMARERGFRLP